MLSLRQYNYYYSSMPFRSRTLILAALFLVQQQVQAVCLNPFGCEPQTQQECINKLTGTRTEAIARAQLAECRKLPRVNLSICEKTESQWAAYMRSHDGKEWDWPDSDWSTKQECVKLYPRMFAASKWVSKSYCVAHGDQIRANLDRTQLETGKSIKLDEGRRKIPNLAWLDERSFVNTVQQVYYPDIAKAELASRLGIDAPTDPLNVAITCHQFAGGSPAEWVATEIARRYNASAEGAQDPTVVRTNALARGKEVIFRYVLKAAPGANPISLREQVLPKTCQLNASNPAFKDGLYYTFEYADVSGRQLSKFSVGLAQCRT
jgi:hypothetical protein